MLEAHPWAQPGSWSRVHISQQGCHGNAWAVPGTSWGTRPRLGMSEPKDAGVASVLDISQTQRVLLSAPAFIAWGQTPWTDVLHGGHDHVCLGLHWECGMWRKLGVRNPASSLEGLQSEYHRK